MKFHRCHRTLLQLSGILSLVGIFATSASLHAVVTNVDLDSGSFVITNVNGITPLTAGLEGTNGDGAIIQLGYYSAATAVNNFAGTWTPLTGQGGENSTYANTSFGDFVSLTALPLDVTYAMSLSFDSAVAGKNIMPAVGQVLAIRFYNGTTLGNSTHYNSVSNDDFFWKWAAGSPIPGQVNLTLDTPNLEWQSIANSQPIASAFSTSIEIVPEPSRAILAMVGMGLAFLRRRRS